MLILLILSPLPASLLKAEAIQCPTPNGLMLHSSFGRERMHALAEDIVKGGYETLTYREVATLYRKGLCTPEKTLVVSLDDLSGVWLRQDFRDMIQEFLDKGLVLTIGVVTGTASDAQDPALWQYFKQISAQGVEIASHSAQHLNPNRISRAALQQEVRVSYELICSNLGECPEAYILPGGNGWDSPEILEIISEKYTTVVSINAPVTYGGRPLLMKRIPPILNPGHFHPIRVLNETLFPWVETQRENLFRLTHQRPNPGRLAQ